MSQLLNKIDQALLTLAIQEDLGPNLCDATTDCLFHGITTTQSALIRSKHPSPVIVCGLSLLAPLLSHFTTDFQVNAFIPDGEKVAPGEVICVIQAPAKALLKIERIALNFLRHLCAIATLTHTYVAAIQHTKAKLLDTRKTTPGMRHLEKYAVACGGGMNHRQGLYDAIMIKDTHVDLLGGMEKALATLPEKSEQALSVIVEVRSLAELQAVLTHGKHKVDRVLLDNLRNAALKTCVEQAAPYFQTEASGNITHDSIASVAESGVDYISVGCLTYAAGQVDLSMQTEVL